MPFWGICYLIQHEILQIYYFQHPNLQFKYSSDLFTIKKYYFVLNHISYMLFMVPKMPFLAIFDDIFARFLSVGGPKIKFRLKIFFSKNSIQNTSGMTYTKSITHFSKLLLISSQHSKSCFPYNFGISCKTPAEKGAQKRYFYVFPVKMLIHSQKY